MNSGYSTSELRKDIEEMEKEKETVAKRIERMQRKVDGTPNVESMLSVAQKLRQERERERELQGHKVLTDLEVGFLTLIKFIAFCIIRWSNERQFSILSSGSSAWKRS
jgi:hypothetical protein